MIIATIVFWSVLATMLAAVEIESEGKYGWAEKVFTWYRTTGFAGRTYARLMNGKPLTGYHAFLLVFVLGIMHAGFFLGAPWSLAAELKVAALYFVWCVYWDYLWFVLNPYYTGRFRKESIWWHAKSRWVFGRIPFDYIASVAISFVLVGLASAYEGSMHSVLKHGILLAGFGCYIILMHLAAPVYHRWYWRMREQDDRDKANIFHE